MRLIPRDEKFYDMFSELARLLADSARILDKLFAEPAHLAEHVAAIKAVEHQADTVTHDVIARIDKSFVTPIDREDIHMLASKLDNVIDLLDGTARRAAMFRITEAREPAIRLAHVLLRATEALQAAVNDMQVPKVVIRRGREVKQLEEEGDAIYHEAVGGLFTGAPDPLDVIKWKEIYDTLERALDECEDVANVLESITLKNS